MAIRLSAPISSAGVAGNPRRTWVRKNLQFLKVFRILGIPGTHLQESSAQRNYARLEQRTVVVSLHTSDCTVYMCIAH
eukprot:4109132-Amphidinium_carterae.1